MSLVTDLPASTRTLWKSPRKVSATLPTYGTIGSASASITFSCDEADFQQFLNTVCGTTPITIAPGIQRILPLIHPQYPGMLAQSFDCEPAGYDASKDRGGLLIPYLKEKITVNFATVPYPYQGTVEDKAFMKLSTKHSAESYTIPNTGYKFLASGIPIQQDVAITVGTTAIELTLYQCPSPTDVFLGPFQGYINSATFLGYAPGCVRFDGASQDMETSFMGNVTYTKTLTFMFRRVGWNYALSPSGVWDTPVKITDGTFMYPDSTDFNNLLQ